MLLRLCFSTRFTPLTCIPCSCCVKTEAKVPTRKQRINLTFCCHQSFNTDGQQTGERFHGIQATSLVMQSLLSGRHLGQFDYVCQTENDERLSPYALNMEPQESPMSVSLAETTFKAHIHIERSSEHLFCFAMS